MQLTVIKNNKLSVFSLPENVSGNYWITDFENGRKINLISIEGTNEGWKLISNNDAYAIDNKDIMIPNIILKDYGFYLLKNNYKNEKYYLYCSPVYDKSFKELGLDSTTKISVGSESGNDIAYKLGGVPKRSFVIEKRGNYYYLVVLDPNSLVFVNQRRVIGQKRIIYGDVIFLYGLKLILMRRDNVDYLLVNNPNNLLDFNAKMVNVVSKSDDFVEDSSELNDDSYYNDNYFYRTPRFYKELAKFELNIDAPPSKKEEDKTPALLTVGPMLTMSMTSVVTLMATFNQIGSGKRDLDSSMTSIVMAIVMLASCLLWPILMQIYRKFANRSWEKKRQKSYKKYIQKKEIEIEQELDKQKKSLLENNFTVTDCQNIIRGHNVRLWQRRISDNDFLTLPVGFGNQPMQIEIKYPEEHFSLTEDNLLDLVHDLGKKERILKDVPITYSFYQNKATGIVGDPITTKDFIDRVVLQIMTLYSYDELKLVTLTSTENESSWDYIKTLPHSWNNDHDFRYFGSSNDDYREIMYQLENIYNMRRQSKNNKEEKYNPHYVIITDAIKSVDSYDFLKNIMIGENYGFSIIMLVDKVSALPNECKSFINVSRQDCTIFSSVLNSDSQVFHMDFSPIEEIYSCSKELANIPIEIKNDKEASLPDVYHFLEMYQVGKVEQLNSLERWKRSNPMLSLQAPVGIGKNGEVITLDLHEKYHGPHGLVAGTTGSGKSEFLITFILSLAVNYHPNEVQVILIDYKGGSLAGAFQSDKYRLPHLAGTITNLDGNELNRSLASIESEVKRRQREFNDARVITNESTIDIYKYQRLYREGKLGDKQPIAHLFIISDEFAELKEQQPEFMDKLISVARVGRSLGVHLILATQKPGGVVDAQIWSNSRFKVCLKVQDTGDSQEVLKKPDAAYLKKTGRFYLQVGYDEVFTLGQSAWAGGQYYPNSTFKKEVDTSVNAVSNIGFITSSKNIETVEIVESKGEELSNLVEYLDNVAREANIKIKRLWLDKIPAKIYIDALKKKYNFVRRPFYLEPIIGEYDDPASQNQYVLTVPMSKLGNTLIYGIAGSGKEDFLTSLIYSTITSYSPEEVNFYILDFGAETLRSFKKAPHVGDVAFVNNEDKIINLFKMLFEEIDKRKSLFASVGGSYKSYVKNNVLPNIVVIINNFEAFSENYEEMVDALNQLSRDGFKYGIYFVVTASSENSIRIRTKQNFAINYVLAQNSDSDYSSILGNVRGKVPAKIKGRGLFKKDNIYEFQTALATEDENISEFIIRLCSSYHDSTEYRAKNIPVLPDQVDFDYVSNYIDNSSNMIIGVNKEKLNIEKYNFSKNAINIISSYELENTMYFVNSLVNEVSFSKSYELYLANTTETIFNNSNLEGRIYTKDFDKLLTSLNEYISKVYELYEQNKFDDGIIKKQQKIMCVIYGVYDFINKLSDDNKRTLSDLFKKDSQMGLVCFVFVDNPDVIKTYAYEDWFKSGADVSRGIWIGSGISDQTLFRISKFDREDREDISNDYGYVINSSKIARIKLLSSFIVK